MSSTPKIIFTLQSGEIRKYGLEMDSIRIGRAPDNTVVLEDESLSAHHAVVHRREEGYEILDLGSTNGIEFDGSRIMSRILKNEDELKIGSVDMRFEWDGIPEAEKFPLVDALAAASKEVEENYPEAPASDGWEEDPEVDPDPVLVPQRNSNRVTEKVSKGLGCTGTATFFILVLLAPLAGMHVRHYQETGKILGQEVMEHVNAKSEKPAAPTDATE